MERANEREKTEESGKMGKHYNKEEDTITIRKRNEVVSSIECQKSKNNVLHNKVRHT